MIHLKRPTYVSLWGSSLMLAFFDRNSNNPINSCELNSSYRPFHLYLINTKRHNCEILCRRYLRGCLNDEYIPATITRILFSRHLDWVKLSGSWPAPHLPLNNCQGCMLSGKFYFSCRERRAQKHKFKVYIYIYIYWVLWIMKNSQHKIYAEDMTSLLEKVFAWRSQVRHLFSTYEIEWAKEPLSCPSSS